MDKATDSLRIALLTDSLLRGGAQKQVVYAAKALHEIGVEVRVYSFIRDGVFEPLLEEAGVPFIWIGEHHNRLTRIVALLQHLRQFRPHIIQTAQLYTAVYASIAGMVTGACTIANMRTDLPHNLANIGRAGSYVSIRSCAALIVNSQKALEEVTSEGLADKRFTYYLPNVVDLEDFERPPTTDESLPTGFRVVLVGRLIAVKRIDIFLEALALAQEHNPHIVGVVIGDGPEAEPLRRQAAEGGIRVQFLGSRDDVPNLIKQCQTLVLSSDHEGFPNVLIEAMAARLPVISTPAGESGRIVADGETGYVVPFGDAQAIADRLVMIAQTTALTDQLGKAGRARVEARYNYSQLANYLFDLYRDLGQKRGNQRLLRELERATPECNRST